MSPITLRYGTAAAILLIVLATLFITLAGLHSVIAYILAVNLTTFICYGFDKKIAATRWMRVPENVLHGLAFAGGSPAALAAQRYFRHKTAKPRFRLAYWLIVALQTVALVGVALYWP